MNSQATGAKYGALALGAIALGCAGFAAYIASGMMSSRYAKTRVVPVVVAKSELKVGEAITAKQLSVVDFPEGSIPTGSFKNIPTLLATHDTVTPTVGILAGEPVVKSRISSSAEGTGVAALVSPNKRAIALEVDASVANTGLVYPGANVDVVVTFRDQDGTGPTATTVVQRARVLSVGLDVDVATRRVERPKDEGKFRSRNTTYVTLEVSPEEAEVVSVARNEGQIDLTLRNGGDDQVVVTRGARPLTLIPELEFEEGEVEAVDGEDEPKTRRRSRRTRRRSRYRSRRIKLRAKATQNSENKSSASNRIETYRAN